jgi:ER-bound oxygenase mpaB/B'/Rubber oxygenase, catalytic domain
MFRGNFFGIMFAMYLGLLSTIAIPTILNVLKHTKRSSSLADAYKRYMQTIFHTLLWFRHEIQPDSKAWKSIEKVRNMHAHASVSAQRSNVGFISQKDMSITQFSFMGYVVLFREKLGIHCNDVELDDFCHFWRVLGKLFGIRDEFNLCCESFAETKNRLEAVKNDFYLSALTNLPDDFEEMSKYVVSGVQCFDVIDCYEPTIYMMKRLVGVKDFYYFKEEFPENYDSKNLQAYKLSYFNRTFLWLSVFTRQILFKFFIVRWWFNMLSYVCEFFVRYFPIVAFFKVGFKQAYVTI